MSGKDLGKLLFIYETSNSLVIDYINEIDVGNANSGLCFFDTARVEFGFPIRSIKSHKNSLFAAASNQTIRLYSIEKESVDEVFECVSPVEDYFSSFDVSPIWEAGMCNSETWPEADFLQRRLQVKDKWSCFLLNLF